MNERIEMSRPDIGEADIDAVVAVLRSGRLSLGPVLDRFEQAFASFIGCGHAIAVSSGTAGLHLCVRAAGLGPGDDVVTSPFSFISSANCLLFEGVKPVFADIDEASLNLDPDAARAAIGSATRGLLPVHVFGQPCAMDPLLDLAGEHGLTVIEDACEAIGAEYRGRKVGTFGSTAVFSFYPNKQMTTGEGAVIVTDDPEAAALIRSLRNQGRSAGGAWLAHERLGYNYRLTDMAAALGLSQLERIEDILSLRAEVADLYRLHLAEIPGVRLIEAVEGTTRFSWFAAIVRLDPHVDRDAVIARLAAQGIPSRAYFAPLHLQPVYRERFGYRPGDFPVTERVARSTLALPFHNRLTREAVAEVCAALGVAL
jgi:perosamine synthetase